ncbi:23S rRNA (uracil(1939)-C(5))-methyltransferase RlmD [Psychrilyobacter atlanticus]|uniref:23S rRNA (uracil(1939)-C(5))-methyltransferase RlmD n=1 Tax=Psychrilyobacter atlanticus TaxID=271091 RepID=UPI0003F9EE5F|nr:23S rRNA (uracil(1939)-C(5))-methyltransferase RlmD [Psychrilyobacter atlanticus]
MKKGNIVEVKIDKIIFGGEGLGYYGDLAVFVPMSVPGDVLEIEIISFKKTYARGLIKKIITPGIDRAAGNKISFEDHHGCDFAMLKYNEQLKYKKLMVEDVLSRVGKVDLDKIEILDTVGAEDQFNYRNKVIEPFARKNGKVISGFFKKKSHEVFEVEENILQSKLSNEIISRIKELLNEAKLSVYNEKAHKGILRHIMVRTTSFNEAMVVLIIKGKVDSKIEGVLNTLYNENDKVKSVYVSINNKRTNFALGEQNIHLLGERYIKEELYGIQFNISPTSFFQINIEQTKKLYEKAISYFDDIKNKNIVDAYSGTGTIAMILSKDANKVYAIEMVESATRAALKTSIENKIENIEFINGKAEEKLVELIETGNQIDSIIFDPPRKGIAQNILEKLSETKIKEVVYISCNPSTFARDTEILGKIGYKLNKVCPVDMFPNTSHIEVVGKFSKN